MKGRMHNKRHLSCQIFIRILDRRRLAVSFFHTVPRVRCQQRYLCQMAA